MSITYGDLSRCIDEAQRFIRAAKNAQDRIKREAANFKPDSYAIGGSRETGAVRRASMDLTRALADLRK